MSKVIVPTDLLPIQTLSIVKDNATSKREKKKSQVIAYIVADLKMIPTISKNSITCVHRACVLIENMVRKKDKIDKFDLIVKIFTALFPAILPAEIELIREIVTHLLDNKLIFKVARSLKVYSYVKKIMVSNLLFREP